jgi:transcriptional regulator with XRE-family HTH domain
MMTSLNCMEMVTMSFPERLVSARKEHKLTQQELADMASISVVQLRRYEAGKAQPTLDVIRNLAVALSLTTDHLIFGTDTRGPDEDLRLEFEAISTFNSEEKRTAKTLLQGLILKHQAERWNKRTAPAT